MTCTYKRKRITGIPDVAIRGLDDEHYAIEQAINCLQESAGGGVGTDLSVIDVTANNVTVASSTGSDAVLPTATTTTAGVMSSAQVTLLNSAGGSVPSARRVDTSGGLSGGGDLSADLTLTPNYGFVVGTVCQGNDSRLSTNLTVGNITASNITVVSSTGNDAVLPAATNTAAGVATSAHITTIEAALRYAGVWAAGTYTKNSVVRTLRWLARANQNTTQDPKPVTNGRKNLIESQRAWAFVTGWARCGIQVKSVTSKTIICGVRVNIPEAGLVNISIGINNVQYYVYRDYYVEAGRWVDLYFSPFTVDAGTKLDIIMESGSRKQFANSFSAGANIQGFIAAGYPVQAGELNTTSYTVNAIYEDITSWPSAWDLLSGY